jgi:hypothetical protein
MVAVGKVNHSKLKQAVMKRVGTLMKKTARMLGLFLFATILLTPLIAGSVAGQPRTNNSLAASAFSESNKVPDFYAQGTSGLYTLEISPKGGYLKGSGPTINFIPWRYVTTQWASGTVYVIFLVNVTNRNFYIGYLYLTNSSSPFILRTFQYQGAVLSTLTFDGIQYVFSRMVPTSSIPMPKLSIDPRPQSANVLSAIGPEIYLNGNSGTLVNDTSRLKLYPLLDQLFQGANAYNELWSLLTDDFGNYYFSILYFQNGDSHHIIIEHRLRLNDYMRLDGATFDANWTTTPFTDKMTVRLPTANSVVNVDGFPFLADAKGLMSALLPQGPTTVSVSDEITPTPDTRLHFSSWSNHEAVNPLTVQLNGALDLTANYATQYLLGLDSEYGGVQGGGWYDKGSVANISATNMITSDNGTRRVFVSWSGDFSSTSNQSTLTMDAPKHITANWKTQYEMQIQLVGVPPNASAQVVVNGQEQVIQSSQPTKLWTDANSQLGIQVVTTQILGNSVNYNFTELRLDGNAPGLNIDVSKPLTISVVYSDVPKAASSIDLKVNPTIGVPGYPLTISGSLTSAAQPSTISLSYGSDNVNWQPLADVSVGTDGRFAYTWTPGTSGNYSVRAYFQGDGNHAPTSRIVSVQIKDTALPSVEDSFNIHALANRVPFASTAFAFAGSLMTIGAAVGVLLLPSASPTLGYLIGSLIVGFVFVFPFSAIVLAVKAARSKRGPRSVNLIPLFLVWVSTLAIMVTKGSSVASSGLLLHATALTLIISNALLFPLAFSVLLAKYVAT